MGNVNQTGTAFMSKEKIHEDLCTLLHKTYIKKNHDYGDSFAKSYEEWGPIQAAIRLEDKLNRFKQYVKNDHMEVADESVEDTLMDLANYALLTVVELQTRVSMRNS